MNTVTPERRSTLRSVAVPTEHGGWGLTLEPALLGLLVAPGWPGACLAVAALLGFMARTPLKVVLVDRRRDRWLHRTRTAAVVAGVELALICVLAGAAWLRADAPFWWPLAIAAPLVAVGLWFDMRSRSRRLAPELAGAVGISAVAAMIVLADGGDTRLAVGLWLIPAARALTAIPAVRAVVARVHGRTVDRSAATVGDVGALLLAGSAVIAEPSLAAGAVAVLGVVVVQRLWARRPPARIAVLGIRQMLVGLAVVIITAAGVAAS